MISPLVGTTLLVGVDFSEGCERALRHAVHLAEQNRAQLDLVHVVELEGHPGMLQGIDVSAEDAMSSTTWRDLARQLPAFIGRLGQLCSYIVEDRVPAQLQVAIGEPAAGLLTMAKQSAASAIVLGAQGRSSALRQNRRAVGSIAERVCACSPVPVLLAAGTDQPAELGARYLFLSTPTSGTWSCSRCGALAHGGASVGICAACGDPAGSWISLSPRETLRATLSA